MDTQLELLTEKWDGILQTIRRENDLSKVAFETWLLPLKIFRIEDHVLKITAPFEQAVTYVENKYKTFRRVLQNTLPCAFTGDCLHNIIWKTFGAAFIFQ